MKKIFDKTSFGWVLLNYLNYPSELWQGLNSAVPNVYLVKPNNVGILRKRRAHRWNNLNFYGV